MEPPKEELSELEIEASRYLKSCIYTRGGIGSWKDYEDTPCEVITAILKCADKMVLDALKGDFTEFIGPEDLPLMRLGAQLKDAFTKK